MTLSTGKGRETGGAAEKQRRRERRESHGRREAEWFYKVLGGRVPDEGAVPPEVQSAAVQIDAWLKAVPAFHRGALSLRYRPKEWPRAIVREFGDLSSLAVRLECALHPAMGKTNAELEKASVERLEKAIDARNAQIEKANAAEKAGSRPMPERPRREDFALAGGIDLAQLDFRADRHVALAIRALGKVRGDAPCVLPRAKPRPDKNATPVTELPPTSSVRRAVSDIQAPNSSVHLVASDVDPSPASGTETEDEDAPKSREGRTWQ
jgi:hypothetical protein